MASHDKASRELIAAATNHFHCRDLNLEIKCFMSRKRCGHVILNN